MPTSPSPGIRCSRARAQRPARGGGRRRPGWLACAHTVWPMLGHVVIAVRRPAKLGGLNEYGLATYKTVDGFAQKEIDWLLSIGGIEVSRSTVWAAT